MISETSSGLNSTRSWRWLLSLLLVAVAPSAFALTALPFVPAREHVTNELARLSALPSPTHADLVRSNAFARADAVFASGSLNDGQALRRLKTILRRYPECTPALDTVATNLVALFLNEYHFVGLLLVELPPSSEATKVTAQYEALTPAVTKLTAEVNAAKTSVLHDPVKHRLDNVFLRANKALIIPFPADLPTNTVAANINGKYFKTSSTAASENIFQATATETNISILVSAIDYPRGLLFSIPNVQPGIIRYPVPDTLSFTNRTGVYTEGESNVGASEGAFFISTTPTEVYGSFECSGPGFGIISGRFRITLSSQP